MAKPKPTSSGPTQTSGTADDAFSARVLEFLGWAQGRSQSLVVVGTVVVLLAVAGLYWFSQRSQRIELAGAELTQLVQAADVQPPAQVREELNTFVTRFSGTPYEIEARLLLAESHLQDGQSGQAIAALEAVVPSYQSHLLTQATFLLATAYEEDTQWERAAEVYAELQEEAELAFQRRQAGEGLVRTQLVQGDTAAAIGTYESLIASTDADDSRRPTYEMRLAELQASQGQF